MKKELSESKRAAIAKAQAASREAFRQRRIAKAKAVLAADGAK